MAAFAAVGSTIPLFNIYRAEDGFTNAGISMTVVAYSAATLTTLFMLGRLSSHLRRRPTSIASLVLLLLGCVLLAPHRRGPPGPVDNDREVQRFGIGRGGSVQSREVPDG